MKISLITVLFHDLICFIKNTINSNSDTKQIEIIMYNLVLRTKNTIERTRLSRCL